MHPIALMVHPASPMAIAIGGNGAIVHIGSLLSPMHHHCRHWCHSHLLITNGSQMDYQFHQWITIVTIGATVANGPPLSPLDYYCYQWITFVAIGIWCQWHYNWCNCQHWIAIGTIYFRCRFRQ
jgi:hypothetical protein